MAGRAGSLFEEAGVGSGPDASGTRASGARAFAVRAVAGPGLGGRCFGTARDRKAGFAAAAVAATASFASLELTSDLAGALSDGLAACGAMIARGTTGGSLVFCPESLGTTPGALAPRACRGDWGAPSAGRSSRVGAAGDLFWPSGGVLAKV
jgi:hypothetical protein